MKVYTIKEYLEEEGDDIALRARGLHHYEKLPSGERVISSPGQRGFLKALREARRVSGKGNSRIVVSHKGTTLGRVVNTNKGILVFFPEDGGPLGATLSDASIQEVYRVVQDTFGF
jgi:hypothetical protein